MDAKSKTINDLLRALPTCHHDGTDENLHINYGWAESIAKHIESLAAKAELGKLAETACKEAWSGMGCGNPEPACEGNCDLYTVCCRLCTGGGRGELGVL